jgi:dTDP-4-amino-4,6-dideoxygalactose transaminase
MVHKKIEEIWESKWLTNMGIQHQTLETELISYLDVPYLTLFCNGTIALELALQALNIKGEVITTPFTFAATVNALYQNNLKPIYCDIKFEDFNMNPNIIEELITSKTSAILPVHVFGNPCNIEQISRIAEDNNLKIIYDAAHCFGVKYKNRGIGNFGDISMFSFHATKIFHTLEGGALTYNNVELREQLSLLKNFGIKSEEEILLPGTNAKMNELQAAIGLLVLKIVADEIKKREALTKIYKENLKEIKGITYLDEKKDVEYNYQYFPILIDENEFNVNRDQLYNYLKKYNIFARKYFYPLCTDYAFCKEGNDAVLPVAIKVSNQILCLPLYGELTQDEINKICEIIINL